MDTFQIYSEPSVFKDIVFWFSILTYFSIFLTAGYLLRLIIYGKFNKLLTHSIIIFTTIIITLLNYFNIYYASFFTIFIIYSLLAYFSYKYIPAKSLKWINLSMSIFIVIIIGTYNLFNTKIHEITYPYFSSNDILEYNFKFKPYFEVYNYKKDDFLGEITFKVDGKVLQIRNDPIEFRIYAFYYVLNTIAILFWLFIYFDILKKHNLKISKIRQSSEKNLIWIKPKDLNPVIHKNYKLLGIEHE